MQTFLVLAQVLLGLFFVQSGLMHFMKMNMMVGYAKDKKLPSPQAGVAISGLMLLAGGLSVLTGRYLDIGLWLLVAFLLLASIMMHAFWKVKDEKDKMTNMHFFMGNMALLFALVMLMGMAGNWPWTL